MLKAVERFNSRLSLTKRLSFKLAKIVTNNNSLLAVEYKKKLVQYRDAKILELYHVCEGGISEARDIMKNGFTLPIKERIALEDTKNPRNVGIKLANHSRYSISSELPHHVLICYVIADDRYVYRYDSELRSGSEIWCSDFTVTNPSLVYPLRLLTYNLDYDNNVPYDEGEYGWQKYVKCGIPKCIEQRKCYCRLYPTALCTDILPHKIC